VLQRRFFERLDAQLHNLYGPTEAAVDVTYWACQRDSKRPVVPIGRPVANTQIYILDRRMQPVPIGVTGELYIGGVQVARGYLNRPELTAERFVKDPFSEVTGARLYRTGDLARYLPDGAVEYLGRVDFQVKIRGLRVELGEIEARIEECNGVGRCVVILREDVPGDKRIVAYYVKGAGADLDDGNLRNHLQEKLPEYMVPQHFVELGQMPLTASGKVDRKALPKLDVVRKDERQYLAPRNKAEKTVAEIWQELLGVEKVGLNDNFFELGGHSLLVMRMVGRFKSQFSKPISVVDIFRYPTVEQLATFFSDTKTEDVLVKTQEYGRKQREALGKHRKKSAQLRH
jgi:acyl carrier protein